MDQNNNNKKPDSGRNNNWRGFIHLICWAVLLAALVSYATSYMTSVGHQASSVELEYSQFLNMLDAGSVAGVDFDNSEAILIITPVDGYVYTDEEGTGYTKTVREDGAAVYTYTNPLGLEQETALELFTVQLSPTIPSSRASRRRRDRRRTARSGSTRITSPPWAPSSCCC